MCMCVSVRSVRFHQPLVVFPQRNDTLSLATSQFATLIYEAKNLKANEISDYTLITKLCVGLAHFSKGGDHIMF